MKKYLVLVYSKPNEKLRNRILSVLQYFYSFLGVKGSSRRPNTQKPKEKDPLMGNPDFIAPIRSKPLSDLYKPPKRNSSIADLYNFKVAQETNTKEPFDPDFFAPLRLPKPSPLVASPQGKFLIYVYLLKLIRTEMYLFTKNWP